MGTASLRSLERPNDLVRLAYETDEPIIVFDGDDECLVAMRPAVFDRILFDTNLLNAEKREKLHF